MANVCMCTQQIPNASDTHQASRYTQAGRCWYLLDRRQRHRLPLVGVARYHVLCYSPVAPSPQLICQGHHLLVLTSPEYSVADAELLRIRPMHHESTEVPTVGTAI